MAREAKRTAAIEVDLPKGVTIGHRNDRRPKPFFVRYGKPRKTESFVTEGERNDKAEAILAAKEDRGASVLNYDPSEWTAFQAWRKQHKKDCPTVDKATADYLALRLAEDMKEDSDTHLHAVTHLGRFANHFTGRRLDSIPTDAIRLWLGSLKNPDTGEAMSKATVRHHRTAVNTFFKRAVMEEWTDKNPCTAVKPPKVIGKDKIPLKPKEIFDLLKANRDESVIYRMVTELFGGLRSSAAGNLPKERVRFEGRSIGLRGLGTKRDYWSSRQGHPEVLWSWLARAPEKTWKMTHRNYDQLKMMAFKLASKVNPNVVNTGNILRDSFCSYLLALTKDYRKVGYFMLHTKIGTTMLYEGTADESDAKLVFAMTYEATADTWEQFLAQQKHEHETSGTIRPDPSGSGESERGRNQVNGAQGAS